MNSLTHSMMNVSALREEARDAENNQHWELASILWMKAIKTYPMSGTRAESEIEKMKCRALAAKLMAAGVDKNGMGL